MSCKYIDARRETLLNEYASNAQRLIEVRDKLAKLNEEKYGKEHAKWLLENRIYDESFNSYHPWYIDFLKMFH